MQVQVLSPVPEKAPLGGAFSAIFAFGELDLLSKLNLLRQLKCLRAAGANIISLCAIAQNLAAA